MAAREPGAMRVSGRIVLLTCIAMLFFAANSVLCRLALGRTGIDPLSFTILRLCSGAGMLSLILTMRSGGMVRGGSWSGAASLFAYALAFSLAYVTLAAGTGALILFGAVQATMIAAGLWKGNRLSALQWLGLAVAGAGLAALLLPGAEAPSGTGAALMAVSGIAWGVYSLLGRGAADPLAATTGNFLRAVPMAGVLAVILAVTGPEVDAPGAAYAVLSGALASGVGYSIWYAALRGLSPVQGATVQLSVPVITALAGAALLGEPLTLRLILCALAVLGGIAAVMNAARWERLFLGRS